MNYDTGGPEHFLSQKPSRTSVAPAQRWVTVIGVTVPPCLDGDREPLGNVPRARPSAAA